MRASVQAAIVPAFTPLEGSLPFMYTDSASTEADPNGHVTTAMGFELPTAASALQLPWKNPDGSLTDPQTVMAQWQAVHDGPANSSGGAGYLTTIRLDADGIAFANNLVIQRDEPTIREGFPDYDNWNAYAQLALWSMVWAMGPAFWKGFPQFTQAMNQSPPNFAAAAPPQALGHYRGSGNAPRIALNDKLWLWAQSVQDSGLDPDQLDWQSGPQDLGNGGGGGTADNPYISPDNGSSSNMGRIVLLSSLAVVSLIFAATLYASPTRAAHHEPARVRT